MSPLISNVFFFHQNAMYLPQLLLLVVLQDFCDAAFLLKTRAYGEIFEGEYPKHGFIAEKTLYVDQPSTASIQPGFSYRIYLSISERDRQKITASRNPSTKLSADWIAVPSSQSHLIRFAHHRMNHRLSIESARQLGAFPLRCVDGTLPDLIFTPTATPRSHEKIDSVEFRLDICVGAGGVQLPRDKRVVESISRRESFKLYAVFRAAAKIDEKSYTDDLLMPVQLQMQFNDFNLLLMKQQSHKSGQRQTTTSTGAGVQTPPRLEEQYAVTGYYPSFEGLVESGYQVDSGNPLSGLEPFSDDSREPENLKHISLYDKDYAEYHMLDDGETTDWNQQLLQFLVDDMREDGYHDSFPIPSEIQQSTRKRKRQSHEQNEFHSRDSSNRYNLRARKSENHLAAQALLLLNNNN